MTNDPKSADGPAEPYVDARGRTRVLVTQSGAGPVEYRPGEMIVNLGAIDGARANPSVAVEALARFAQVDARYEDADLARAKRSGFARMVLESDDVDVPAVVELVNRGLDPDGAPGDAGPFAPNVVFHLGGLQASPMKFGGALGADPMKFGSTYGVDPMKFGRFSTARPATGPLQISCDRDAKGPGRPLVAILDTGFPLEGPTGESDVPFKGVGDGVRDRPDDNADDYLDIAAGHSTFIRTIIDRSSPVVRFVVEGVITNDGDGAESDVAAALEDVYDRVDDKSKLILNLSFSGYYFEDREPPAIAFWIRQLVAKGAVVVAAAGNDGDCRPKYPAAMQEVLSVGSFGSCGPSWFSNHGPWVNACAPGEDIVSEFFQYNGALKVQDGSDAPDIDDFSGWAVWSGTSFSTPNVVGALCEIIELTDCSAQQAVQQLVKRRGLFRIPDYGVVVNRIF